MNNKIVIAHRGASGYLPEHTLEAKALAFQMGASFLEQDLAMTKDDRLVVIHDHYLDRLTDVAEKYPEKVRDDGRYYVIDFTLQEIKSLNFTEGFKVINGKKEADYPNRFPIEKSIFKIHTFEEEIEFIQGLNKTTGKNVGLYTETKAPWFHKQAGKDISKAVLKVLKDYGYTSKHSNIYFQTFDLPDLIYVKEKLMPEFNMDLKTIFLFAENSWNETYEQTSNGVWQAFDFDKLKNDKGMEYISRYVDGVGPSYNMIIDEEKSKKGSVIINDFVCTAHKYHMLVHPYTVRKDMLPDYVNNINELFDAILMKADADGVFTDFPDLAVSFLQNK